MSRHQYCLYHSAIVDDLKKQRDMYEEEFKALRKLVKYNRGSMQPSLIRGGTMIDIMSPEITKRWNDCVTNINSIQNKITDVLMNGVN